MRKVYQPPEMKGAGGRSLIWALALTFLVFLLLPLTQMVSASRHGADRYESVEAFAPPPPPPPVEEPPPQEDEPEPEPEDLQEDTSMPPMSLSQLDMMLEGGVGSGYGDFSFGFQTASNMMESINIFDLSDVDKPPTPTMQAPARYPSAMQREGITGSVILNVVVDEKGKVSQVDVENSTHPAFEQPAASSIKKWVFEPAYKDGKPVRARIRQPYHFRL